MLLAAVPAAGQSTPPPDPLADSMIRVGPFGLTPALAIRDVGRDSNVFNDPDNPKDDFTATVSPKADVLFHSGRLLAHYITSTDYVYFQTYKSERSTNVASSVRLDLDLGPLKPFAAISGANTRDRSNREVDARARHHDRTESAGVALQFDTLTVTLAARHSQLRFDDEATFRGQSLAGSFNSDIDGIDATVGMAVTPLTTVSVITTRERERFELSPDRDSETWRVMPTVTFSPLAILQGKASFGYRQFTAASPDLEDFRGFVSSLGLGTTLFERHRLEATFARELQYSYESDTPYYVETGGQLAWTYSFAGPMDLRLMASRSKLHYRGTDVSASVTDDVARTYGASLGYRVRQRFRIGLNADWLGRDSERSGDRAYRNRKIYANLTWGT